MRSRSPSLESVVCALYLSMAVSAMPLPSFDSIFGRSASPQVYGSGPLDPRVQDFADISIDVTPDIFQSQDIPPSFVRPSRRRTKAMDGVPTSMADELDDLDAGPQPETFSADFHEEGDDLAEPFWEVMEALQATSQNAYSNLFGIPSFRGLRKLLPFLQRENM